MSIIKTIGRLLIITVLISSAYLHISKPEASLELFKNNYNHTTTFVEKYAPGVLPIHNTVHFNSF